MTRIVMQAGGLVGITVELAAIAAGLGQIFLAAYGLAIYLGKF